MGPHATYPVKAIMGMVSANAKAYDTETPDPDTSCKASHLIVKQGITRALQFGGCGEGHDQDKHGH